MTTSHDLTERIFEPGADAAMVVVAVIVLVSVVVLGYYTWRDLNGKN